MAISEVVWAVDVAISVGVPLVWCVKHREPLETIEYLAYRLTCWMDWWTNAIVSAEVERETIEGVCTAMLEREMREKADASREAFERQHVLASAADARARESGAVFLPMGLQYDSRLREAYEEAAGHGVLYMPEMESLCPHGLTNRTCCTCGGHA